MEQAILHHYKHIVKKINQLAPVMEKLSEEEIKAKTKEFQERYQKGTPLSKLLPEAFALVREAAKRTLGYGQYDVQLIGGLALHDGLIAEMKTGEGKTLVSTAPAYLNALTGKGVHIVTVNDYLAERDAEWMGQIHRMLGLSVGCVLNQMDNLTRRKAYACDITYVTNNELGFDYLRDNMVQSLNDRVLRGLHYCIIDEADSVLIDEARTPLIISGASTNVPKLYHLCDVLARQMEKGSVSDRFSKAKAYAGEEFTETGDFIVDEDNRTIFLTADGEKKVEGFFGLSNFSDEQNVDIRHHILLAIQAHYLMKRDVDYIVRDGEVLIVDTFTGRVMEGRRYSDGLHQAIEAKERVEIQAENLTQATITLQNFFNKYEKKSGMTGTGASERREFRETYHMDVLKIPTNRPVIRKDLPDHIYRTKQEKFEAVVREIQDAHEKGQPVLVGTVSIEVSEKLSRMLQKAGIHHQVLNAKFDKEEADIVAKAGEPGMVTIATNMAGRGTDIKIPEESKAAGGLKVIGTERHESKRIDDQLRGRSGRQGDPGESRFFVSLEDDLIVYNGKESLTEELKKQQIPPGAPFMDQRAAVLVNRAQEKVELDHFGMRESLMHYDALNHIQREHIYRYRQDILEDTRLHEEVLNMFRHVVAEKAERAIKGKWKDPAVLQTAVGRFLDKEVTDDRYKKKRTPALVTLIANDAADRYDAMVAAIGNPERFAAVERNLCLRVLDTLWVLHLSEMEKLQEIVRYQTIGQKDPLVTYRMEAARMYDALLRSIEENTVEALNGLRGRNDGSRTHTEGNGLPETPGKE